MEKEWAIIFLIYADFREAEGFMLNEELVDELNDLFSDLSQVQLNERTRVFVIINRVRYIKEGLEGVVSDKTFVYEVEKGNAQRNKLKKFKPAQASLEGKLLPHSSDTLSTIFDKISENIEDKRIMMITWDHGSVFGIFNVDAEKPERVYPVTFQAFDRFAHRFNDIEEFWEQIFEANDFLKQQPAESLFVNEIFHQPIYRYKNIQFIIPNKPPDFFTGFDKLLEDENFQTKIKLTEDGNLGLLEYATTQLDKDFERFNSILNETEKSSILGNIIERDANIFFTRITPIKGIIDILTNEELSDAVATGIKSGRVEVLLMMNCTTMNLHSMYAYRKRIDFLIAPQGIISKPGYSYLALLNDIMSTNPPIKEENIVERCLNSTFDFSDAKRKSFEAKINQWAIFSADLRTTQVVDELADKINELGKYLSDNFNLIGAATLSARKRCFRFDDAKRLDYNVIDITHFLTILTEILSTAPELKLQKENISLFLAEISRIKNEMKIDGKQTKGDIYNLPWRGTTRGDIEASGIGIYFPEILDKKGSIYRYFVAETAPGASNFLKEKGNWLLLLEKL